MRAKDIEVGKEYGVRSYQGVTKAVVIGTEGRKAKLDRTVDYRTASDLRAVLGLWVDHPEWQERLDAIAESKRLANEMRLPMPAAKIGSLRGELNVTLPNADAARLIEILKANKS